MQNQKQQSHALRTVGDAYAYCETRIEAQLVRAEDGHAAPNASITGDTNARNAFLLLLPEEQQRELFLKTARNSRAWPRLGCIFGAPPFHFLRSEDAGMLRAAGFARGRANMAFEHGSGGATVPSSSQFGAHFVDAHDRAYRLMASHDRATPTVLRGHDAVLAGVDLLESLPRGIDLHFSVKITRRSLREKQRLIVKDDQRETLLFPRPGQQVELRETTSLATHRGRRESVAGVGAATGAGAGKKRPRSWEDAQTAVLHIRAVALRGQRGNTAALIAKLA
jgi:hypothetical protein